MNKIALVFVACFVLIIAGVLYGESQGILKETPLEGQTQTEGQKEGDATEIEDSTLSAPEQKTYTVGKDSRDLISELFMPVTVDAPPANHELQNYISSQVSFSENTVQLTAIRRENIYLSGRAESQLAFRYGTFSFRIHTMRGTGYFPAIWLLPVWGELFPEVDIYELVGDKPNEFYGVLHYIGESGQASNNFQHTFSQGAAPESYVLRFEWEPNKMTWYLEDQLIYTIEENVPDMPMYMILNLAIGGTWPGDPTPETVFPATFSVEVLDFQPKETFTR